jgi:hypothetical protein
MSCLHLSKKYTVKDEIIVPSEINTDEEIRKIFQQNKLNDLKQLLYQRHCLNITNMTLGYLFHIVQSAGVLTTTIAAGYDIKMLVWVGIGMNVLASLINVYEKLNTNISKKMLKDIISIKNGTYIDQGMVVDGDEKINVQEYKNKPIENIIVGNVDKDIENQTQNIPNISQLLEPLIPNNPQNSMMPVIQNEQIPNVDSNTEININPVVYPNEIP